MLIRLPKAQRKIIEKALADAMTKMLMDRENLNNPDHIAAFESLAATSKRISSVNALYVDIDGGERDG